jgi:hypothetical protein
MDHIQGTVFPATDTKKEPEDIRLLLLGDLFDVLEGSHLEIGVNFKIWKIDDIEAYLGDMLREFLGLVVVGVSLSGLSRISEFRTRVGLDCVCSDGGLGVGCALAN